MEKQRIENPIRENLSPEDQEIWDRILGTRGGIWGPYAVLMHLPQLAKQVAGVGEYLRFHGRLSNQDRECAILALAGSINSSFEWSIHEPIARDAGLSSEALEAIKRLEESKHLSSRQNLILRLVKELLQSRSLSDESFKSAIEELGRSELIEVITIVGFYQLLAYVIESFKMPLLEP